MGQGEGITPSPHYKNELEILTGRNEDEKICVVWESN